MFKDGSDFEDDTSTVRRPLNHFFDPVHDRPLTIVVPVGQRSPDWALEDQSDLSDQAHSLKDARGYLYRALTLAGEEDRKRNFGLTFQTLGQVIHHVQDMAQPEHTRNDPHLDNPQEFLGIIPNPFYDPSLYESYTNQHRGGLPYTGYGPVAFPRAREYWTTGDERGMADFTNRNFLSKDTNFTLKADGTVSLNVLYARPFSTGPSETVPIQTLLQGDGTCLSSGGDSECGSECGPPVELPPACGLVGEVVFYGSLVQDNYAGGPPVANPRASTLSIFDQDLEDFGRPPIYYDDPDDPLLDTVEYQRLFTLNRFNFQYAYPHLIPKAVAYSAGLVDFFFRGRIEVLDVSDDEARLYIEIKNISGTGNNFTNGKFELYYDAIDGQRRSLSIFENATSDLTVGGKLTLITEKPILSQVDLSKENPLMLVYRGQIGQEEGIAPAVPELPLSGFVVSPSAPADGVYGTRLLFHENGRWNLAPSAGFMAGNVDWKGVVNGRTKVLSWHDSQTRNLSGWYVGMNTHITPFIYMNGKVFAVAPSGVRGAALTRDSQGDTWLLAIVTENDMDVVYRRPAKRSTSAALHDPVNAPDGWKRVGEFTPGTDFRAPDRPWFFNSSGTQAQTMRMVGKTLEQQVNGVVTSERTVGLDRLSMDFSDGVMTGTSNHGNLGGYVKNFTCQISNGATWEGSTSGEYIVGVDYQGDQEVLAKVSVNKSLSGNIQVVDKDLSILTHATNTGETLTIGQQSLEIYRDSENNRAERTSTTFEMSDQTSASIWRPYLLDLRHDLLAYAQTESSGSTHVLVKQATAGSPATNTAEYSWNVSDLEYVRGRGIGVLEVFKNDSNGSMTDRWYGSTTLHACMNDLFLEGLTSAHTRSLPITGLSGFAYNRLDGGWLMDSAGRVLVSQSRGSHQYALPRDTYFNSLTGEFPGGVIGSPAEKQQLLPIGLVK